MDQGKAFVTGRLSRDPDFKDEGTSAQRAMFSIAYNRGIGEKRKSNFLDCIAWGKRADIMRDFKKGSGIYVTGDIEQDTYETKDGNKRNRVQINITSITATTNLRRNDENVERPSVSNSEEEVTIGGVDDNESIPF